MNTEIQEVQLNTYPAYKDSGVEWLGVIPEHWEVKRIKHFLRDKNSLFIDGDWIESKDLGTNEVYYFTTGNIRELKFFDKEIACISTETFNNLNCTAISEGDILISRLNLPLGRSCLAPKFDKKAIVSVDVCVFRPDSEYDRSFLVYVMNSPQYFSHTQNVARGAIMKRISRSILGDINLPLPPRSEQTAIANFLDDKCAKIDAAVEIKQQQIELLKERRQIAIHQAVTQGLDPSVPMKDSGVEWIGEIPEHWSVKRLKNFIINLESGVSVNGSESQSASKTEIGVLKTSCVYNYVFEPEQNKKVEKVDLNRVSCPVIKDRIIISRMNAPELVGASGLVKESFPNLFLPDRLWQTVFNADEKFDTFWLSQVLVSKGFRRCITAIATGSSPSMKNITKGDFLNLNLAHPPFQEQKKIAKFIEELTTKIDTTISLYEQEIEKLKEYKTVLINSAVTGKIKVNC